ncbi:MAG: D-alanyl-D-alanine carboxypeptidase family protein [Polaromonas sp.]|nr:D-alanyl-D-alanine carboxypeptidase family protein [Gemmatimonadaceae bacterium]
MLPMVGDGSSRVPQQTMAEQVHVYDGETRRVFIVGAPPTPVYVPTWARMSRVPKPSINGLLTGKSAGLVLPLRDALSELAMQLGQPIDVVSGRRTRLEQEVLYQHFLAGIGNLSALPGTSHHETGEAADVYVGGIALAEVPRARAIGVSVGLEFPVSGEPWHVELVDGGAPPGDG